jgi:hypothetical protein
MEFKQWIKKDIKLPPKILWITGLNSSGSQPKILNRLGYDCKIISTLSNLTSAYLGRFKRYSFMKYLIQKKADEMGKNHMLKNAEKHDEEIGEFEPHVVVGSSQGGAVAMEIANRHAKSKYVLAAPAWKIFNADPSNLPKDTIIVHGTKDITVPLGDSIELTEKYGYKLITYEGGHKRPLGIIIKCINMQLARMGIELPLS